MQCGVCFMMDHPTNWSPYFRDDNFGRAYDLGGCQGHQGFQDQQYNNYSNTYNEGWWDHSNYDYSGNYQEIDLYANYNHPSSFNQSWSHEPDLFQPPPQNSGTSL